ncbi:MAG: LacI family transcriptional regulator [Actinobacteria bacterium]|nr:LacI family transcriptional regulator [Actinomycetota bacterium]
MVTSKDVAKLAGVSRATVSHVVNKSKYVSKELKLRVEQAMKELAYHPDAIAKSLKARKTHTIGVVIPNIMSPFYPPVVKGIEDVARESGYQIFICSTEEDFEMEEERLKALYEKRVDGLIIVPVRDRRGFFFDTLLGKNVPIVLLDRKIGGIDVDTVSSDNYDGAYAAVRHFLSLGYKNIAIVAMPLHMVPGKERLEGYKKALQEHGLSVVDNYVKVGNVSEESGYERTKELLNQPGSLEAILVCNHLMAMGAFRAIKESKLRIPEDIALIAFDDFPWTPYLSPSLTTVAQSAYELGATAANMLIERIEKKNDIEPRHVVLKSKLIVRESCGANMRKR